MLIYLRPRHFGGIGGEERFCCTFIEAFPEHTFEVQPLNPPSSAHLPATKNWRLVERPTRNVDLYWQLTDAPSDPFRGSSFHARRRILMSCGNPLRTRGFDAVVVEAPTPLPMPNDAPVRVVPWPVLAEPAGALPSALPSDFVLTVFNPYGWVKGAWPAFRAARVAPLVWCMDDRTFPGRFRQLADLARRAGTHVVWNAPRSTIWALYNACSAYVCCSYMESFGASIAEAAVAGAPLVSRKIGVAQYLSDVDYYETLSELPGALSRALSRSRPMQRDLRVLSVEAFRERVHALVA